MDASVLSTKSKMPMKHIERIMEIIKYQEKSKEYRLKVKKRIFRDNLEVFFIYSLFLGFGWT